MAALVKTAASLGGIYNTLWALPWQEVGKCLAGRLVELCGQGNLYLNYPENAGNFFHVIKTWGPAGFVDEYVEKTLKEDPNNVFPFLRLFTPRSYSMGVVEIRDLTKEVFDSITAVVDPSIIYDALKEAMGDELDQEVDIHLVEREKRPPLQFASIFKQVQQGDEQAE